MDLRKIFGSKDLAPLGYTGSEGKCPRCGSELWERHTPGVPSGESFMCSDAACGAKYKKTSAKVDAQVKDAVDAAHAETQRSFEDLREQQNLVVRWIQAHRPGYLNRFKDFSTMVIKIMEAARPPAEPVDGAYDGPKWEGSKVDGD